MNAMKDNAVYRNENGIFYHSFMKYICIEELDLKTFS